MIVCDWLLSVLLAGAAPQAASPPAERPDILAYHAVLYRPGPSWNKAVPISAQPGVQAHGAYMAKQSDERRIVLGGPFLDSRDLASFSGALVVWATDSAEEARRWAEADPAVQSGLFTVAEVRRIGVFTGAWRPWAQPAAKPAP
jgi:uncharacterized protein YciI